MNLLIKPKVILIVENDSAFDVLLNFKFLEKFKSEIILIEKSQTERIKDIPANLTEDAFLVFNYDNESLRKICQNIDIKKISFGFSEEADFKASDVNELENSTNFKINYRGNTVPVWLKKISNVSEIYNYLSAVCAGTLLGLNIIEISDSLKF